MTAASDSGEIDTDYLLAFDSFSTDPDEWTVDNGEFCGVWRRVEVEFKGCDLTNNNPTECTDGDIISYTVPCKVVTYLPENEIVMITVDPTVNDKYGTARFILDPKRIDEISPLDC